MSLTYDAGALSATCYDYGALGGNGQYDVGTGAVVLDNSTLELPAGSEELQKSEGDTASGPYFSGDVNGNTTGTITFDTGNSGTLYLVFKTGGGQNDPYFFAFALTGVNNGESVDYAILDPDGPNALSNLALYGNPDLDIPDCPPTAPNCNPPDTAPEPTTLALLGIGLLGAGYMRRRTR
jgi:hypothetical protein